MAAATYSEVKPRQLQQIARLLREEEEENWISGEELYTEGSSDDEGGRGEHASDAHAQTAHGRSKKSADIQRQLLERRISAPAHLQHHPPPPGASEPVIQDEPHLTETSRRLSQMGVDQTLRQEHPSGASPKSRSFDETVKFDNKDEVEEQEEVMLWRPKRGSVKLPHHVDLEKNARGSRSPQQQKVSG